MDGDSNPNPAPKPSTLYSFIKRRAKAAAKVVSTTASRSLSFRSDDEEDGHSPPGFAAVAPEPVERGFMSLGGSKASLNRVGKVEEEEDYGSRYTISSGLVEVELEGRNEETEPVLRDYMIKQLQVYLPPYQRESSKWKLLYRSLLLCISDEQGITFGAYLSEPIQKRPEGSFYGTGNCFLWTNAGGDTLYIYPPTGENEFYMTFMVSQNAFAIGSGGEAGGFGLLIDDTFEKCQSGPCATFNNPRLSGRPRFYALGVEVWGFEF
ncbi:TLD-domain-containing protein [Chytridium lagenaria]|nr:TLD-domain-containing protein [Chytridium lagenaria]